MSVFLLLQQQQQQEFHLFKLNKNFEGQVISLIVVMIVIVSLAFYYNRAIKRARTYSDLPKLAFLIFSALDGVTKNTRQILGKNYDKAIPFFLYVISFFGLSNLLSIVGFKPLGSSFVIPVSLGIVIFIGTISIGIYNRRFYYIDDYLFGVKFRKKKILPIPDVLKLIGEFGRIISLTCRLGGNTLAGSLILFIIYDSTQNLFNLLGTSFLSPLILPLFVFPLHIYFDIVDGTIQPMIFMLLGMCYWGIGTLSQNKKVREEER